MYVSKKFHDLIKEQGKIRRHTNDSSMDDNEKEKARDSFRNWIFGIALSFLPLLILPFARMHVNNESHIKNIFVDVFSNYEVIFIGISSIVSFMNDLPDNCTLTHRFRSNFTYISLLLLMFGCLFYATRLLFDSDLVKIKVDSTISFGFNSCYFVIIFLLGCSVYIKGFMEE